MKTNILPKGYYRAYLLGCAGSPSIVVYSNGKEYYSFDSENPSEPQEDWMFDIDETPLFDL